MWAPAEHFLLGVRLKESSVYALPCPPEGPGLLSSPRSSYLRHLLLVMMDRY